MVYYTRHHDFSISIDSKKSNRNNGLWTGSSSIPVHVDTPLHKPLTQRKPINLINDRIYRPDTVMNKTQGELDTQALSKLVLLPRYVTRVNLWQWKCEV